ncbi:MAG: hypothetical protein AB7T06_05595 [Kofleriaceae bacterium]
MKYAVGVLVLATLAGPRIARADEGGIKPITIVAPGERPMKNKLVLGGIAGAGLVAGAIGFYFHLDSRSATDDVGTDVFTGTAWSPAHQELVDRADSSRAAAITLYSIGGACIAGAIVYWILTDPGEETIVIQPRTAQPTIVPTQGGAVLGGVWSF